eukprot:GHVQ01040408.1.p1 GENE.GHVQ01040408.1~~GHVQ01040408.1.p1  ORF type:complete len:200 (+),score=22.02 GHVQ01040408.1:138-737(+)
MTDAATITAPTVMGRERREKSREVRSTGARNRTIKRMLIGGVLAYIIQFSFCVNHCVFPNTFIGVAAGDTTSSTTQISTYNTVPYGYYLWMLLAVVPLLILLVGIILCCLYGKNPQILSVLHNSSRRPAVLHNSSRRPAADNTLEQPTVVDASPNDNFQLSFIIPPYTEGPPTPPPGYEEYEFPPPPYAANPSSQDNLM